MFAGGAGTGGFSVLSVPTPDVGTSPVSATSISGFLGSLLSSVDLEAQRLFMFRRSLVRRSFSTPLPRGSGVVLALDVIIYSIGYYEMSPISLQYHAWLS